MPWLALGGLLALIALRRPRGNAVASAGILLALLPVLAPTAFAAVERVRLRDIEAAVVPAGTQRISRAAVRATFDATIRLTSEFPAAAVEIEILSAYSLARVVPREPIRIDALEAGETVEVETSFQMDISRRFPFELEESIAFVAMGDVTFPDPAPVARFDRTRIDLGVPGVSCPVSERFTLTNDGDEPLEVRYVLPETIDPAFRFPFVSSDVPFFLSPGQSTTLRFDYVTFDEEVHEVSVRVLTNDPDRPSVDLVIAGGGTSASEVTETIEGVREPDSRVDLLISTDRSGSMADNLARLRPAFAGLLDELFLQEADLQVAAVHQDDGCPVTSEPFASSLLPTEDAKALLETQLDIENELSIFGANTERLFMVAEAALSPLNTGAGGCLDGFLREDARLVLLGISDEPEQSVFAWPHYAELFRNLKGGDASRFVYHAIAGDYPSGCDDEGVSAQAGTGYFEMTRATGGLFTSICEPDVEGLVPALAAGVLGELGNVFPLAQPAVAGSLRVTVDGEPANDRLQYDPPPSRTAPAGVDFLLFSTQGAPSADALIEATYVPRVCP